MKADAGDEDEGESPSKSLTRMFRRLLEWKCVQGTHEVIVAKRYLLLPKA